MSGPDAMIVFPHHPVALVHDDGPEVVANARYAITRNPRTEFRLRALCAEGDRCHWLAVPHPTAARILRELEVPLSVAGPFGGVRVPLSTELFRAQRVLFDQATDLHADPLAAEEALLALLATVVGSSVPPPVAARQLTRAAEVELSQRFRERLTLAGLASLVGCSQWHLARCFRAETGITLHRYRDQLRVRAAADRLRAGCEDLTALALDLGYASHSHFTDRFRAAFGVPPSAWRAVATRSGPTTQV